MIKLLQLAFSITREIPDEDQYTRFQSTAYSRRW